MLENIRQEKLLVALNIVISLLYVFLFSCVVLYADDYYYASFCKNGIRSFINMNIDHYQEFNGRVLVHILAQLVLWSKPIVFPVLNLMMLSGIFLISAKTLEFNFAKTLYFLIIAKVFAICIPVSVMVESILWVSGSFNYLFPTLMIIISLTILIDADTVKIKISSYIILFISGATTEQCGLTLFCISVFLLIAYRKNIHAKKQLIISSVTILLGVITIFCRLPL